MSSAAGGKNIGRFSSRNCRRSSRRNYTKREFETTAQYEKRIDERLSRARSLIKRKTNGDELVFFVPISSEKIQYNADAQTMTVGREYSGLLNTSYSYEGEFITLKSSERAVGTYTGENAFGVKRQIIRMEGYEIGFSAPKGTSAGGWPSGYGAESFKPITMRVDSQHAKEVKEQMSVVFSGRLRPPYLVTTSVRTTPKIDMPFDRTTAKQIVQIDIDCAAVFDRAQEKVVSWISIR